MSKENKTKMIKISYTRAMQKLLLILVLATPQILFAKIPTPGSIEQKKANAYGTYTSPAGSWGYNNTDPILTQRSFGASNSYGQYAQMQRSQNYMTMAMGALQIFTSKGTFGEKVKFLMMDQLNRRFAAPAQSQLNRMNQSLSFDALFAMANQGGSNPLGIRPNGILDECIGCDANAWKPSNQNQHSVRDALSQTGVVPSTNSGAGGLGDIVSPVN